MISFHPDACASGENWYVIRTLLVYLFCITYTPRPIYYIVKLIQVARQKAQLQEAISVNSVCKSFYILIFFNLDTLYV